MPGGPATGTTAKALWHTVPTPMRVYLESILGASSPITEKDFKSDELVELFRLIADAEATRQESAKRSGLHADAQYKQERWVAGPDGKLVQQPTRMRDYFPKAVTYDNYQLGNTRTPGIIGNILDPENPLYYTLGQFRYESTPEGYIVHDKYDFPEGGGGAFNWLQMLGRALGLDEEGARPVTVNVKAPK